MTSNRVTVVIASYNHERFVEEALRSVYAQDINGLQVIVTDDASEDQSQARINALREEHGWTARRIFHTENLGLCATFNEALAAVTTEFVTFLAADDRMTAGRLSRQVAELDQAGDSYALCHSDMSIIDEHSEQTGVRYSDYVTDAFRPHRAAGGPALVARLLRGNWLGAPSVLLRTQAVRQAGGYDEELWSEDYDLWLRIARRSGFVYVNEPLVDYRKTTSAMTGTDSYLPSAQRDYLRSARKHLGLGEDTDEFIRQRCFLLARELYRTGDIDRAGALEGMAPLRKTSKNAGVLMDALLVTAGAPRRFIRRWKR